MNVAGLKSLFGSGEMKARVAKSTFYTIVGFGSENFLRLAGNLVLTRLLFPEAFGLMALIQVVLIGLAMFSDLGIRAAIIQNERGEDPDYLNTAWTIQIGRGVLLWLATWVLSIPVANFYNEPLLASMLPVAGLLALFQGFESTKHATANRDLSIGRLTAMTIGSQIAGLAVTIGLAYWLQSVWGLVIGGLVAPALSAVLSHIVLPGHSNKLNFEKEAAWDLIRFGRYIFLSTIAGFLINQGDRAILGKFVTLSDLALYNIAFFLATVPLLLTQRLMDFVIFPLYSRRPPTESEDNRKRIRQVRLLLTGGVLALAIGFALFGNWLIILLYDDRYEAAGPLLVLIALGQIPALITASYYALALAAGHSGRFAALIISNAVIRTTVLLAGVSMFGTVGAALAPLVAVLLYYPIQVALIRRYKSWDPIHDIAFAGVGLVASVIVIWVNSDALAPVFAALW